MGHSRLYLLLSLAAVVPIAAQSQSLDPEFTKVPFDQWFAGGRQARINWSARIFPPRLSDHQRLWTGIQLQVDGAELARRRGQGQLLMFVQVKDAAGRRFQTHESVDLEKLEEGIKSSDIIYSQRVFVMPGDYRVALALYDTATQEYSIKEEKLHVAALDKDPLPGLWRDLPLVEIVPFAEPPDSWFLPTIRGRLRASLDTQRALSIEVIVNVTPTERFLGSRQIQDRSLGVLISTLKVISEIESRNASVNVELVDLSRQRVIYHQESVRNLDWEGMKASLAAQQPATIDVQSLENRSQNASFFVKEVERKLAGEDRTPRILIILSRPVSFEAGEDLRPIVATAYLGCKVFYLRYHYQWAEQPTPLSGYSAERSGPRRGGVMLPGGPARLMKAAFADQLAPLFKPLAPRLFDIETPEQFRKVFATLLAEMASM
jgi:hypothetical protein